MSQEGQIVVTSRQVSEDFEKEHNDTKKRIRELIKDMGEISHNYLIVSKYRDLMNRVQEEYLLIRDRFSLNKIITVNNSNVYKKCKDKEIVIWIIRNMRI